MNTGKRKRKMLYEKYPGNDYIAYAEMCKTVARRTGLENNTVRFIMDSYRDIMEEEMMRGSKIDVLGIGYIVYRLKRGFFSPMLQMVIPNRYLPIFIVRNDVKKRIGRVLTEDKVKEG